MNFKFNLKKYLVLGLVGLGVVIGDSNADRSGKQYNTYINNAVVNTTVNCNVVNSELRKISDYLANVMKSNLNEWKNIFADYLSSIRSTDFSSFLSTFEKKVFKSFGVSKSFEYNDECIQICKTLLSFVKIIDIVNSYNLSNKNKISFANTEDILYNTLVSLNNSKLNIDDFINKYTDQYKLYNDCGVLGVLEYLFNNSRSSVSADQYVNFLKSIIKDNGDGIVTKTINNKVDCGRYSFFPFSDDKNSESINTLLQGNNVNVNKVLSLLENIGYSKKMTTSEAWLLSQNPKLDAVTELTNEKLVEASKLGSSAELYDWISKQSTTGETPVVSHHDKDKGEQGGGNPEDKGGNGFVYVANLSDKLGGKKLKIECSKTVLSGFTKFELRSQHSIDQVISAIKANNGKLSLDLSKLYYGKDHTRGKLFHPVLKSCFIQFREGDKGWRGSNDIINIEIEQ